MKARMLFALAVLSTLVASLLYVRSRFFVIELSYALAQKQALKGQLEQKKRAISLELSTLRSPVRVGRIAREQLGLRTLRSPDSTVVVSSKEQP